MAWAVQESPWPWPPFEEKIVIDTHQKWHAVSFGPSVRIAEAVDRCFTLGLIVNEKRAFRPDLYNFAMLRGIEYRQIEHRNELAEVDWKHDVGICFGFGVIFDAQTIERFGCGIWNIHAGKLPEYRSRHPIGWALIENQPEMTVTIHTIDSRIDRGHRLGELTLPISVEDNEQTLSERVERLAARDLIDLGLDTYRKGTAEPIGEGRYLPSLQGRWDSVDPAEFDSIFLFNLIRSKMRYGGVEVAGKRYTRCDFVCPGVTDSSSDGDSFTCKDGIEVCLS